MSALLIPCPKCGKELKLPDRRLLGKKGKCPGCQYAFVLAEPDEVQLELADAGPVMGAAAQWVPDGAPAARATGAVRTAPAPAVSIPVPADEPGGIDRLREMKRRKAKRSKTGMIVGGAVGVAVAGVAFAIYATRGTEPAPVDNAPKKDAAYEAAKQDLRDNVETAKAASPTDGKPIELLMMPLGVRVVLHLHPADLWSESTQLKEFRFCFGPIAELTEAKIKQLCLFDPPQIDELTLGVIYREQGEAPDVCGVVRLKEEAKKSELLKKFAGEPNRDLGHPVYVGPTYAYLISSEDPKTFAFGPKDMAKEMVEAVQTPSRTDDGIEQILTATDRGRLITLVFRPDDLRLYQKELVADNVLPFLNQVLDWFNPDEVEAVAWNVHLTEQKFHSEMLLRNKTSRSPPQLQADFRRKLDRLPDDVLAMVEKMDPKQIGNRKIIGRFPAMTKVFAVETVNGIQDRYVQLNTVLPERAGPNLAIGALLAWDESTRTDFTKAKKPSSGSPTPSTGGGADSVVAKLQKKIEIDFRKTPLQDAFAYIAEETQAKIDIDGDGLKLSGYTKNMEQNMQLGQVTGQAAIREILKKYKDMCILVDEDKKTVTVTTKAVAEKLGKKPFDLGS